MDRSNSSGAATAATQSGRVGSSWLASSDASRGRTAATISSQIASRSAFGRSTGSSERATIGSTGRSGRPASVRIARLTAVMNVSGGGDAPAPAGTMDAATDSRSASAATIAASRSAVVGAFIAGIGGCEAGEVHRPANSGSGDVSVGSRVTRIEGGQRIVRGLREDHQTNETRLQVGRDGGAEVGVGGVGQSLVLAARERRQQCRVLGAAEHGGESVAFATASSVASIASAQLDVERGGIGRVRDARRIGVGASSGCSGREQRPCAHAHGGRLARRANRAEVGRRAEPCGRLHRRVGEIGVTGDEGVHAVGDEQIGVGVEHLVQRRQPLGEVGGQSGDERAVARGAQDLLAVAHSTLLLVSRERIFFAQDSNDVPVAGELLDLESECLVRVESEPHPFSERSGRSDLRGVDRQVPSVAAGIADGSVAQQGGCQRLGWRGRVQQTRARGAGGARGPPGSAANGAGASTQPYAPRRKGAPAAIICCRRRSAMPVSQGSTRKAAVSRAASTARNSAGDIGFHRSAKT